MRASAFAIPLKDESVQTVVTSPSYFGLRRYPGGTDNDLGREKTIGLYVEHLVIAMREVWRVLRNDGAVFLNLDDTYHGSGRGAGRSASAVKLSKSPFCDGNPLRGQGRAKSLCLIPHRVMIALQDDGWIVRNDVIWTKPNSVPDSVRDRCTSSYEHIIILTKNQNYYWNAKEAREPSVCREKGSLGGGHTPSRPTRNLRDVWVINTRPHKEAHIAMFPEPLVERCIRIASRPGDWVLDCFAGSGTTGVVARELRRNAVLVDISAEYCQLIKNRLSPEPFESLPVAENKARESSGDPVLDFEPSSQQPRRTQTVVVNQEFTQWARTYSGPKFHACVCDPSYGIGFMGAKWDDPKQMIRSRVHSVLPPGQWTALQENTAFQRECKEWGEAMLPLLFPGALVMMFAGPRMWDWVATGMQMAGFEHWDTMMWLYGSGFPKAMDIGRQVAKFIPETKQVYGNEWQGFKTPALKPSWEPILCFRAPRQGITYAELAFRFGTGALNADGGRIAAEKPIASHRMANGGHGQTTGTFNGVYQAGDSGKYTQDLGRYPANLILDEESAKLLDAQSGVSKSRRDAGGQPKKGGDIYLHGMQIRNGSTHADEGGVSRFFYVAKASKKERNAGLDEIAPQTTDDGRNIPINNPFQRGKTLRRNIHPTVKPLALCRYLATLLLPPESVAPRRLLVPFAGSGSEMIGAMQAGWDEIVGIEQNPHYCEIARARLQHWRMAS
jgi:DNA modification methylase